MNDLYYFPSLEQFYVVYLKGVILLDLHIDLRTK